MPTPGRNDYCPCGSGRKYKRCCADKASRPDLTELAAATHELDQRLVERILRFGVTHHPAESKAAFDAFPDSWMQDEAYAQIVFPIAAYVAPIGDGTLLDRFLAREGERLDPRERDWLEDNRRAWLSIWEIVAVDPERSMQLRDLLTGEERTVIERKGTRGMRPRVAMLARVVDWNGMSLMVGSHPRALEPANAAAVVEEVRVRIGARSGTIAKTRLLGHAAVILLREWEAQVDASEHPPLPKIVNSDGDVLVHTTDRFAITAGERAFVEERLASLDGVELMSAVESEDDGQTRFAVLRPARTSDRAEGRSSLGSVEVGDRELVVLSTSEKRADALRVRIEKACGTVVRHVDRDCRDMQDLMASSIGRPAAKRDSGSGLPPEVEAQMLVDFKRKHYATWPDTPLPALKGLTPRQAMTKDGTRRKVESLLKEFEYGESRCPPEQRFDVRELRRELGLGEG